MKEPLWTLKFIPTSPFLSKPRVVYLPNSPLEKMSAAELKEWLLRIHQFFQEILIATGDKEASVEQSLERVKQMTRALKEIQDWINKKYGQDPKNPL